MSLYTFYYYTAIWQHTNQPKATTAYAAKGLKISIERVRRYKAALLKLKLIEEITLRSNDDKHIAHHYIRVEFYESEHEMIRKTYPNGSQGGTKVKGVRKQKGNAYSTNNKTITAKNRDKVLKLKKSKKLSFDDRCSQKLEKMLRKKRLLNKMSRPGSWSTHFSEFRRKNNITKKRMKNLLSWYVDHFGEKYIPKAFFANMFCEKFMQIEDAYERFMEHVNGGGALEIEEEHEYADPIYGDGPVDMGEDE